MARLISQNTHSLSVCKTCHQNALAGYWIQKAHSHTYRYNQSSCLGILAGCVCLQAASRIRSKSKRTCTIYANSHLNEHTFPPSRTRLILDICEVSFTSRVFFYGHSYLEMRRNAKVPSVCDGEWANNLNRILEYTSHVCGEYADIEDFQVNCPKYFVFLWFGNWCELLMVGVPGCIVRVKSYVIRVSA